MKTKTNRELLNEKQAAERLSVKPGTLQVWLSTQRVELPYIKLGRAVRYDAAELEKFLNRNTVQGANS